MKKLQKKFNNFLDQIKCDETSELREKRDKLTEDIKKDFPELCSEYGIEVNKSDLQFFNQGSYIIGTAIHGKNVDIEATRWYSICMFILKRRENHEENSCFNAGCDDGIFYGSLRKFPTGK